MYIHKMYICTYYVGMYYMRAPLHVVVHTHIQQGFDAIFKDASIPPAFNLQSDYALPPGFEYGIIPPPLPVALIGV